MENPIRILHVIGLLNRGGIEAMVMNLYRNIDRSKIQFDFIVHSNEKCDYNDEIYSLGGRIYSIPKYCVKNHFSYKKAWFTFFKTHNEYKIIHGHVRSTASIYLKIAKKFNLITISHSHNTASEGNIIEQLVKYIMQFPIRYTADYFFACSDDAGKWLFGKKVLRKCNYKVIKNAIEVEKYIYDENKRNEMRKKLNIEDNFVIGHVGSFIHQKNHKMLINIFYEVQQHKSNSILLIVGDGELRPQIEKQINDLGIKDKVILTGVVPNVNDYMQAMDKFLFPSFFEGLGIVTIEAQASGLRSIVSDVIPKEAFITNLIESLSLKSSVDIWMNKVIEYDNSYERRNTYNELRGCKYDIQENVILLRDLYINMLGD